MVEFLKRLDRPLAPLTNLLVGLLILTIAFGQELFSYSFSIDDYYHSIYPPRNGTFGRVIHELLYDYILRSEFVPFFSFIIGLSLLCGAIMIFCKTIGFRSSSISYYIVLIFFGLHAGFIDTYNNNSHIVSHPLSIFFSILAITLVHREYNFVIASLLFFLSLSLFQPFAAAGLILAVTLVSYEIIMSHSRLSFCNSPRIIVTILFGTLIYIASNELYFELTGRMDSRIVWSFELAEIYSNFLRIFKYICDNFFSTYIFRPTITGVISFVIYVIFCLLLLVRSIQQSATRFVMALSIVVFLPIVPFAAKIPIAAELPVRGQACFGLVIGASAAVLYETGSWDAIAARLPKWLSARFLVLAVSCAAFLSSWYVITLAYDHQRRTELRDRQVASQMLVDVYRFSRENGLPTDHFLIAGQRGVDPEKWYYPITANAFSEWWGATAIFYHVGFVGSVEYVKNPNIDCAPWPSSGSLIAFQGKTLLCLSEMKKAEP